MGLLRVCILANGIVKATFSDCSLVLLAPQGTAFLHVDSSGTAVQQCTQFALRRVQPKLAEVLELRNLHCNSLAVCNPYLAAKPRPGFASCVPVDAVRWPGSPTAATVAADGQVMLVSEDSCAKLVLHPSGLRLAVTWPAQVPGGSRSFWATQSFSTGDCPAQWQAPLQLALAAQRQWAASSSSAGSGGEPPPIAADVYVDPTLTLALAPAQCISQLPALASHRGVECCSFPPGSWWLDTGTATFPPDVPVLLEWTPEAVYQYLPHLEQVEVVVAADGSILRLDCRGYLQHHLPGSWQHPRTYAAQAVPSCASGQAGARYRLAMIASHAQALREVSAKLCSLAKLRSARSPLSGNPLSLPAPAELPAAGMAGGPRMPAAPERGPASDAGVAAFDPAVRERQVVPGYGTFTEFVDGRVCVDFEDRSLLKLAPGGQQFEALLPSGRLVSAPVSRPAELHAHVASAREFAAWAAATPKERGQPMERQRGVQAQLSGNQRLLVALGPLAVSSNIACSQAAEWRAADEGEAAAASRTGEVGSGHHPCSWQGGASTDGATGAQARWGTSAAAATAAFGTRDDAGSAVRPWGPGQEQGDYMWELVSNGILRARDSVEREAVVEAWLRRNSLLLERLD